MLNCILEINISMIHLHLLCLYFMIPPETGETMLKPSSNIKMKPFIMVIKLIVYMFTASRQ